MNLLHGEHYGPRYNADRGEAIYGYPEGLVLPPEYPIRPGPLKEVLKIKVRSPNKKQCELPTLEEAYIQNVYEAVCGINIHKRKGGNRDQTLTDIRGILGVTIVSVVPGTTRDLPHTFITNLSIKFQLNRNLPPRNYVQKELLPGMQSIPGISNFTIKRLQQVSSVENPE